MKSVNRGKELAANIDVTNVHSLFHTLGLLSYSQFFLAVTAHLSFPDEGFYQLTDGTRNNLCAFS
jgi:hypothetical protein